MNSNALRGTIRAAADDSAAQQARRALCRALSVGFQRTGELLRTVGHIVGPQRADGTSPFGNGDDRLVALGYLSETAAALTSGAVDLVERENLYAAAALNRQLVEVEYLTWAFAEDHDEAATWLRSTQQERRQRWQPAHLRKRAQGRFRSEDYSEHCEVGGHPSPRGFRALFTDEPATSEILLAEVANHGSSSWDYLLLAAVAHCLQHQVEPLHVIPDEAAKAVGAAEGRWRRHERLIATWQKREALLTNDRTQSAK